MIESYRGHEVLDEIADLSASSKRLIGAVSRHLVAIQSAWIPNPSLKLVGLIGQQPRQSSEATETVV